nr:MBL fold metallo-hydrolase [Salinarimonas soli]
MATHAPQPLPLDAGPYRFSEGAFEITILSDGFIMLPPDIVLPDTPPPERAPIMEQLGGTADGAPFQVNIPLIRTKDDLILVDNGSGIHFQASAGRLAANLKAAGIGPEAITKVVFTHIHPDHSGGTTLSDGSLLCPNAHYFVADPEWRFWTDPNYEASMPSALHGFARGSQRDMAAVADRLTRFRPGDEIVSGFRSIATPGHTPGHVSFELAGGEGLIIAGDVATSNVVFFEHPSWHFGFDTQPDIALKSRQAFLDRVAAEKIKVLGYHWAYPGLGYAERKGAAYRFVAA